MADWLQLQRVFDLNVVLSLRIMDVSSLVKGDFSLAKIFGNSERDTAGD